jgi:methyl-accepting chemotaxis protein
MKNIFKVLVIIALVAVIGFTMIACNKNDERETMYLARQYAQYWIGKIDGYIKVLQTISNLMNSYENLEPMTRRQEYEKAMQAIFEDMPEFIQMFTVWKPNAIDGMDARFIGRVGATATGQFAYALTRETGQVQVITSTVVQEAMAYMTGPDARVVGMSDPVPFKNQRDTYAVRITVPIFNKRANETVGVVGCLLDIDMIQPRLEKTIKDNDGIASMAIYTDNGFILANYSPERIGKKAIDVEVQYDGYINDVNDVIKNGYEWEGMSYDPVLRTNMFMAITPITLADSPTTWALMIGSTEDYINRNKSPLVRFFTKTR